MGDDRRLVEWTRSDELWRGVTGTVTEQLERFEMWGRGAQLLLLEFGGYWDRVNEWMKDAVEAKDAELIKQLLKFLIKMPTCSGQLMANKMGLPKTVQELLETIVRRAKVEVEHLEVPEFASQEELETIASLCCDLFVRWLKIKKSNWQESDDWKVKFETAAGEKGVIAKIEGRANFVFLELNGLVSLMKIGRSNDNFA